jgi:membrane protein implicated in regulation of membrane protease activity
MNIGATEGTAALLGRVCEVEVAIENGYGRVLIGGVSWSAEGSDMPAGTPVRVVSVDANRVAVERYNPEK